MKSKDNLVRQSLRAKKIQLTLNKKYKTKRASKCPYDDIEPMKDLNEFPNLNLAKNESQLEELKKHVCQYGNSPDHMSNDNRYLKYRSLIEEAIKFNNQKALYFLFCSSESGIGAAPDYNYALYTAVQYANLETILFITHCRVHYEGYEVDPINVQILIFIISTLTPFA